MWLRLILFVASLYAPPSAVRGEGTTMSDKLDPILASLFETATSDERGHAIMIVVAVRRPADGDMLRALAARGFTSRLVVGTMLTGTVEIGKIQALADYAEIVRLEGHIPTQRGQTRRASGSSGYWLQSDPASGRR